MGAMRIRFLYGHHAHNSWRTCSDENQRFEGPTRKPRHASVFSTHSDTQAAPAFHCIGMFKGIFSTRAFFLTHRHAVYQCLQKLRHFFDTLAATVSGSTPTPWSGPFRDHVLNPPLSTENPTNTRVFSGSGAPIFWIWSRRPRAQLVGVDPCLLT